MLFWSLLGPGPDPVYNPKKHRKIYFSRAPKSSPVKSSATQVHSPVKSFACFRGGAHAPGAAEMAGTCRLRKLCPGPGAAIRCCHLLKLVSVQTCLTSVSECHICAFVGHLDPQTSIYLMFWLRLQLGQFFRRPSRTTALGARKTLTQSVLSHLARWEVGTWCYTSKGKMQEAARCLRDVDSRAPRASHLS